MPTPQEMLARYSENVAPPGRKKYTEAARRFVEFAQGDFGHDRLVAYLQHLQRQGYAPGTVKRFDLTVIRRFYKVNGLDWPLKHWEVPTLKEGDVYAPALSPDLVRRIIEVARAGEVPPEDAALAALSTTYGLRRAEMCGLGPEDVDLKRGLLHVFTLKHGRERWHLIPQEIAPYLFALPKRRLSPTVASKAFYRIEKAAGLPRMGEVGWHAIRRALVRGLVQAGLPEPIVRDFLRWKRGTTSDMLLAYYSTQVVGIEGTFTEAARRDEETDREVFQKHPFLPMWR